MLPFQQPSSSSSSSPLYRPGVRQHQQQHLPALTYADFALERSFTSATDIWTQNGPLATASPYQTTGGRQSGSSTDIFPVYPDGSELLAPQADVGGFPTTLRPDPLAPVGNIRQTLGEAPPVLPSTSSLAANPSTIPQSILLYPPTGLPPPPLHLEPAVPQTPAWNGLEHLHRQSQQLRQSQPPPKDKMHQPPAANDFAGYSSTRDEPGPSYYPTVQPSTQTAAFRADLDPHAAPFAFETEVQRFGPPPVPRSMQPASTSSQKMHPARHAREDRSGRTDEVGRDGKKPRLAQAEKNIDTDLAAVRVRTLSYTVPSRCRAMSPVWLLLTPV